MREVGRYVALVGVWALVFTAWFVQSCSFDELKSMRRLERIPRSQIASVIEGEVHLSGRAREGERNVFSITSNRPCFYYHYLKERKERSAKGGTSWVTEEDTTNMVPFYLEDATGRILVEPDSAVTFHLEEDFQSQKGNTRITEWRIDPGDTLFVFGYAIQSKDAYRVGFTPAGNYSPIISQFGEEAERGRMAFKSLSFSFLAIMMLSFSAVLFCIGFSLHRILLYLLLVSLVAGSFLLYLGIALIHEDLTDSDARVRVMEKRALKEVGTLFREAHISWSSDLRGLGMELERSTVGLSAPKAKRVKGIYRNLALAVLRHNETLERFPENILRRLFGISPVEELAMQAGTSDELRPLGKATEVSAGKEVSIVCLIVGLVIALLCTLFGFDHVRQKRFIENVPTSKTHGLAFGPCEVKGRATAKDEDTLRGPVSGERCVYYRYRVQERKLTGENKKAHWTTTMDVDRRMPFLCEDDEGTVRVDLTGAEVHTTEKQMKSQGNMRHTEWSLWRGDDVYILGSAVIDPNTGDRLQIGDGDDDDFPFIVANLSEDAMLLKKSRSGMLWLNGGLNGMMLSTFGMMGLTATYAATEYLFAALVAPGFLCSCLIVLMYNDLQFVSKRVSRAWANIDVSLKKRANLIPNLESVVKQYMAHENQLQKRIADSRRLVEQTSTTDAEGASRVAAEQVRVTDAFLAVMEKYPDLRANELTAKLSRSLIRVENEIALMQQGYNDSVERYNTLIERLPEAVLAFLLGFHRAAFFTAEVEVRKPIQISVDLAD